MKGVSRNAKDGREEYKRTGAWLQDAIPFKSGFYLDERSKIIANELFGLLELETGYKIEQKQKDFEALIANLLDQTKKPIIVSLNRNDWKQTKYNQISYSIIDLIQTMDKKKLIEMKTGYNTEQSRMTRIWATEKLLQYFPEIHNCVLYKPVELVELRELKSGKLKEYKDTEETHRIRHILQRINEVNKRADIRYSSYKLNSNLVAIFKGKFTLYGRLHTRGYRHYQNFSGDERKEITINGNPTIELDYKALHPNLLYASIGIQYVGDPYTACHPSPEARPFLKIILLSMLNAKDLVQAEKAAIYWLLKNPDERELLKQIGITRAKPLIDAFLITHAKLSDFLCSGKETGLRIMNRDSKIALDVVNHFGKQNIPILCIHDSFVIQSEFEDELRQVMKATYVKHTNGFRIIVK